MKNLEEITGSTILIVDDNPTNLGVLEEYLEEYGVTILVARDGESGVEKALYARPDLILLDVLMPGMDGFEVCSRLKSDDLTRDVPVIFMTALIETVDKVRGFEVGGVDYLTKPVDHEEVLARITTHLAMNRLQQQIQREHARFRTLSEAMFDGLLLYENQDILDVNQAIEQMFDYQREELLGKKTEALIAPVSHPIFQQKLQQETTHPYQVKGLRKDGLNFPVEIRCQSTSYQGRQVNVAIIRNLSREKALEQKTQQLEAENLNLKASLSDSDRFGEIIGRSPAMRKVYERIISAAAVDETVIIYGETGTGKELVARTIFQMSESHTKIFVPVNCSAIPEDLFESQMFGYRKGAFTGAERNTPGYLDRAQDGTLFLDEVGELSLRMQAKLLRVLQDKEYTPVGATTTRTADARIIAATNRDLGEMLRAGTIREDFFHRLHVITVKLPPLRWRKEDIPLLIEHFLVQRTPAGVELPTIPIDVFNRFFDYDWPGNVRELLNELRRYLATGELELAGHRPAQTGDPHALPFLQDGMSLNDAVGAFEHYYISRVLRQHGGQKALTAEALGVGRKTLYNKLKKHGGME